jgi:hypothetical protein
MACAFNKISLPTSYWNSICKAPEYNGSEKRYGELLYG